MQRQAAVVVYAQGVASHLRQAHSTILRTRRRRCAMRCRGGSKPRRSLPPQPRRAHGSEHAPDAPLPNLLRLLPPVPFEPSSRPSHMPGSSYGASLGSRSTDPFGNSCCGVPIGALPRSDAAGMPCSSASNATSSASSSSSRSILLSCRLVKLLLALLKLPDSVAPAAELTDKVAAQHAQHRVVPLHPAGRPAGPHPVRRPIEVGRRRHVRHPPILVKLRLLRQRVVRQHDLPQLVGAGRAHRVVEPTRRPELRQEGGGGWVDGLFGELHLLNLGEQIGVPGALDVDDADDAAVALGHGRGQLEELRDGLVRVPPPQDGDGHGHQMRVVRLLLV
eukprot:scaffold9859_cov122-Isochrysis_galbana.AAC.3